MSWISMLETTYNNCPQLWGRRQPGDTPDMIPLLTPGQSTQNAQIDVLLDAQGHIIQAQAITDKISQVTIIPCTEGSIGRTNGITPHPLHDKLQYLAGDYAAYGGEKKPGWKDYIQQLSDWCSSPFAHPRARAVLHCTQRGRLIHELVAAGVFLVEDGKLVDKGDDEQKAKYPLLSISGLDPLEAFVRFRVQLPGELVTEPWLDDSLARSFLDWQSSLSTSRGLCYVSGQMESLSQSHPNKLRHTGDKAKLISSNDSSGFTYKGRFHDEQQAVGVSYVASQKAHNMLKWLISRQGFRNDSQVFVAWGTRLQPLPQLHADSDDLTASLVMEPDDEPATDTPTQASQTGQALRLEYANRLKHAMAGYGSRIQDADSIVVMGVDAATPGRMAVIFYREIAGSDFLGRIEAWHSQCAWLHGYKTQDGKQKRFYGAPSPRDIVLAAYGIWAADKLVKATIERLLCCIVDGKPIPADIRQSLVRRAGNPPAMESWEWRKTVSIACAAIRQHLLRSKGGTWNVALDDNNLDRSYLFGRLLAYAQHAESYAQYVAEKSHRQTNAERMMHQLTLRPARTWAQLSLKLQSYMRQLNKPGLSHKWSSAMQQIVDALGQQGFTNEPLDERYLLGYSSQLMALRDYAKDDKQEEEDNGSDE